jgi:ABC-type uncharacterized transport system permease subunit
MSELLSLAFVSMVLALAVPYVLAALAGCLSERGGVIDLALEAKLLAGALAAASVAHGTGSIVLGALAGALAGALVGAAQAALIQRGGANPVIVGVGLNLVALGGTRYLLGVLYGDSTSSPPTPPLGSPLLGSPSAWLALLAALAVPWWLARTRAACACEWPAMRRGPCAPPACRPRTCVRARWCSAAPWPAPAAPSCRSRSGCSRPRCRRAAATWRWSR